MKKINIMKSSFTLDDYNIKLLDDLEYDINSIRNRMISEFKDAFIILKEKNKVSIGKIENEVIDFLNEELNEIDMFLDIRIFNKEKELYIWKDKDKIKGRIIIDNNYEYFDETVLIFGENIIFNKSCNEIILHGSNSKEFKLPYLKEIDENSKHIYLKIRNYLNKNSEDGLPYIKCWRAVEFLGKEGE